MIPDNYKHYSLTGDCPIGGPTTWHVIDWDQRRIISVTTDGQQDDDELAIAHLSRIDSIQIARGIYRIHVSDAGEIISTYSDPEKDATRCVPYPSLGETNFPEGTLTTRRDELEELERLGPDVDLVAYPPCHGGSAKKVGNVPNFGDCWSLGTFYMVNLTTWAGRIQVLLALAVWATLVEGDEPVDASPPPRSEHCPI